MDSIAIGELTEVLKKRKSDIMMTMQMFPNNRRYHDGRLMEVDYLIGLLKRGQ